MKTRVIKEGLNIYGIDLKIGDTFELCEHGSFSKTEGCKDETLSDPTIQFSDKSGHYILLDNGDGTVLSLTDCTYIRLSSDKYKDYFELI